MLELAFDQPRISAIVGVGAGAGYCKHASLFRFALVRFMLLQMNLEIIAGTAFSSPPGSSVLLLLGLLEASGVPFVACRALLCEVHNRWFLQASCVCVVACIDGSSIILMQHQA